MMAPNVEDIEKRIVEFMKHEVRAGHLESTVPDIADGTGLGRSDVVRVLERLDMKGEVRWRERGTTRKATRYYCLARVLEVCQTAITEGGT